MQNFPSRRDTGLRISQVEKRGDHLWQIGHKDEFGRLPPGKVEGLASITRESPKEQGLLCAATLTSQTSVSPGMEID
ncbi:MAG: hypothetical protein R3F31_07565 [Verrucomicrobiales bacterium]